MRADRLIALLLLLQRRGQITAAEAAAELEVSERTARRDLEALAMSGVPVYSRHGRGGGWQLVGGASTDLTGLSADEARALFLAAGSTLLSTANPNIGDGAAPPLALSTSPELSSALRKLTSALPQSFQDEAEAASTAIKIDTNGWGQVRPSGQPEFLPQLTNAVVGGRQIRLDYQGRDAEPTVRVVHPLGLVTKRNIWYLIGDTKKGQRTFRVGRVRGVEILDLPIERPPGFDLDQVWNEIVTAMESRRMNLTVRAQVDQRFLTALRWTFGDHHVSIERQLDNDRVEVTIAARGSQTFVAQIAGFADLVELVDPPASVTAELSRVANELYRRYGETTTTA